jgi:hypothetical protein
MGMGRALRVGEAQNAAFVLIVVREAKRRDLIALIAKIVADQPYAGLVLALAPVAKVQLVRDQGAPVRFLPWR